MITLYTIGFTQKSAKAFFEILMQNNVKKIIDIRLNNSSQLAGFTQKKYKILFKNKSRLLAHIQRLSP